MVFHVDEHGQVVGTQLFEAVAHIEVHHVVDEFILRGGVHLLCLLAQKFGSHHTVHRRGVVGDIRQHVQHVALVHVQNMAGGLQFVLWESALG